MPLTLGTLRVFCRENASPDSTGATAAREFMNWINDALYRLYDETDWDRTMFEERVTLPPRESGTDLILTQGSLQISRTSADFPAKYVTDRWSLVVSGEGKIDFELASIAGTANPGPYVATLRDGDEWIGADGAAVSYWFAKNKIAFPQAREVKRVEVLNTGLEVQMVTPEMFDRLRTVNPNTGGTDPSYCTFRRGRMEVWPHPGSTYSKLGVTYRRGHMTPFTTADVDATDCRWDEEVANCLKKAIVLEAAISLGEGAVTPYPIAKMEYQDAVNKAKAVGEKRATSGPMHVSAPPHGPRGRRVRWSTVNEITDA